MLFRTIHINTFISGLICSVFVALGQSNTYAQIDGFVPTPWPQNSSSIGPDYSPVFAYRTLRANDSEVDQAVVKTRNENESPLLSNSFGISYQLKRFSDPFKRDRKEKGTIYTACIRFTSFRYKDMLGVDLAHDNDPVRPIKSEITTTYRYIQIPLSIGFFKSDKQWTKYAYIGVSPNIKTTFHQRKTTRYSNGEELTKTIQSEDAIRPITLSAQGALGMEYESQNDLIYFIEPFFQYDLTSTTSATVREFLWSTGIRLGFRFRL